jgi:hypothetical protein
LIHLIFLSVLGRRRRVLGRKFTLFYPIRQKETLFMMMGLLSFSFLPRFDDLLKRQFSDLGIRRDATATALDQEVSIPMLVI